jgi:YD repeat-containing protein
MVIIMTNSRDAIAGAIVGIIIGFVLALIVLTYITSSKQPTHTTVTFERDESGRIVAIHYVQGSAQGGINA